MHVLAVTVEPFEMCRRAGSLFSISLTMSYRPQVLAPRPSAPRTFQPVLPLSRSWHLVPPPPGHATLSYRHQDMPPRPTPPPRTCHPPIPASPRTCHSILLHALITKPLYSSRESLQTLFSIGSKPIGMIYRGERGRHLYQTSLPLSSLLKSAAYYSSATFEFDNKSNHFI